MDVTVVDGSDAEVFARHAAMLPFARNADLPWMMSAHIVYPAFDAALPATLSPIIVRQIIRELEESQKPVHSPMILNGSPFGFFANRRAFSSSDRFKSGNASDVLPNATRNAARSHHASGECGSTSVSLFSASSNCE